MIGKNLVSECLQAPRVREPPANKQTGPSAARQPGNRRWRPGLAGPRCAPAQPGIAHPLPAIPHSGRPCRDFTPTVSTVPPFPPAQCSDLLPANPTAKSAGRNSALQSIYFALQLKKRVLSLTPRPLPQPTAVSSPPHRAAERSPRAFLDPLPLGMATSTLLASVAWPGWG